MATYVWDWKANAGKTVEDSEAERGVAAGEYSFRKGVDIPLQDNNGDFHTVKSEDAGEAFQQGFKLRQRKSSEQIKKEAELSVADQMEGTAFLKNALSVPTLGLSDVIARSEGIEPSFAQAVDEANPVSTFAGTAAGVGLSMVTPFGIPGVGAAASALGKSAEAGLALKAGTSLGSKAINNAVGKAANMGADGLVYGFGEAVSEAALGDPNNIANSIILGGGLGAAMGGVVGGMTPIASAISKKILDKAQSTIVNTADTALPYAATQAVKATQGKMAAEEFGNIVTKRDKRGNLEVKELVKPEREAFVKEIETGGNDFIAKAKEDNRSLRKEIDAAKKEALKILRRDKDETSSEIARVMEEAAQVADESPLEAAQRFEEAMRAVRNKADLEYGEADATVRQVLKEAPLNPAQSEKFANLYSNLLNDVEKLKESPKYSTKLGAQMESIMARFADATSDADNVANFVSMRRAIGQAYGPALRTPRHAHEQAARGLYESINTVLDSMDNMPIQKLRAADASYSKAYEIEQLAKPFRVPKKSTKLPAEKTLYTARKMLADRDSFEMLVNNLEGYVPLIDEPIQAKLTEAVGKLKSAAAAKTGEQIAPQEKLLAKIKDTMVNLKTSSPDEVAELITSITGKDIATNIKKQAALKDALAHIRATPSMGNLDKFVYLKKSLNPKEDVSMIEDIIRQNEDLSFIQQFRRQDGVGYKTDMLQMLGGASSIVTGSGLPVMATLALGKAIDIARSPYSLIAALPVIENAAKAGRFAVEKWSNGLSKALTSKPVMRSVIGITNEKQNYENRVAALKENADIPAFIDRTAASLQPLGSAPQVQFALMNRIQTANNYLQTQIPKDPLEGQYINPAFSKWKPTSQDVAKFNRVYEAVENPRKAMDKFADGVITPEEVQAIKAVHPDIFNQMQGIVINTLTEMKEPVAYEKRLNLGIMFEVTTDPTMQGEYINYMQTMINKYAEGDKKPKSNLKFEPETLLSDSQRISMR